MLDSWVGAPDARRLASLGREIAAGAGFVGNVLFWRETDYFAGAAETRPLLHLWSLGVEEQFYLVWPITLFLVRRHPARVVHVIAAGFLVSFALNIWRVREHPVEAFFLPHTRLWELFIGAWLAHRQRRVPSLVRHEDALALAGAALLVAGVTLLSKDSAFPGWWALLPTVGAALVIAAGPHAVLNRRVLASPPAVFVGLISYPLYLWHWPLLAFARNVSNGEPSAVVRAALMVLAVFLAWMTWRYVEKPIRSSAGMGRIKALSLAGVMLFGIGLLTQVQGGFAGRFPELVQQLAAYQQADHTTQYRVGKCFLSPDQRASEFAPECIDAGFSGAPANIFLWGDSHAAHFYPGLRAYAQSHGLPLAQFNAGGCPPILGFPNKGRPNCEDINRHALREIAATRPKLLLVSAHWPKYVGYPEIESLVATITAAKAAGAQQVWLIGPVPNWRPSLPKVLLEAYQADSLHRLPMRLRTQLNDSILETDGRINRLAAVAGVPYFSPMQLLCEQSECLTRLGDGVDDLTAWDYGHLTAKASRRVVDEVFRKLDATRAASNGN